MRALCLKCEYLALFGMDPILCMFGCNCVPPDYIDVY